MPDVNDVFWQINLCGTGLGILAFAWTLWRDGLRRTVTYWLDPPSFGDGPVECFVSLAVIGEKLRNPPPISPIKASLGLCVGLFHFAIGGFIVGGFLLTGIYMTAQGIYGKIFT